MTNDIKKFGDIVDKHLKGLNESDEDSTSIEINGQIYNVNKLPDNLTVEVALSLEYRKVKKLPKNLTVGSYPFAGFPGGLNLYGNHSLKELPENLTVNGILNIKNTGIHELPQSLKVNGYILVGGNQLHGTVPPGVKKSKILRNNLGGSVEKLRPIEDMHPILK